ncbi:hypothetical protein AA958_12200 [Streptomyces sp. CNQ-509]|uniref:DUF6528 family protein n=1 Tax=unclassified Streptomyces TaxID=2593676 RepID=UPI00062E0370|nr:DUF6528 family protein [Streptomyces sp. CNQ-509]AKH82872.1 hypothetical protein AA958_12200 [Streptomyces sp. CNQ-509]
MTGRPTRRTALLTALGAGAAATLPAAAAHAAGSRPTPPVAVTDQKSRRVLILDSRLPWDSPDAVRWAFSPEGDERYADLVPQASWTYVDEAKARRHKGRTYLLTSASFGFAAVVEVPTGRRYWAGALAGGTDSVNPHSVELLPDGNVAVAGSTGDTIRLYAASQGPATATYFEYRFDDAHGLQWDTRNGLLWAIGYDELIALRVGGTPAAPTLTRVDSAALPHPDGVRAGGHDLSLVASRPGRLWLTTNYGVYQYDIARREFSQDFAGAAQISRRSVKAVSDVPGSGRVATTVPEPGLGKTWWTTTVSAHNPEGAFKLPDSGIYKARWWLPEPR